MSVITLIKQSEEMKLYMKIQSSDVDQHDSSPDQSNRNKSMW